VTRQRFDPYVILAALESRRVEYVLIGGFARVVQGTEELTAGLDLTPSMKADNVERLRAALDELGAKRNDGKPLRLDEHADVREPVIELHSRGGQIKLVPEPAGTRGGYDDLRRAARREPLGRGLRPRVAPIADLARMTAALGRQQDVEPLRQLRYLRELERGRYRGIER